MTASNACAESVPRTPGQVLLVRIASSETPLVAKKANDQSSVSPTGRISSCGALDPMFSRC